MAFLMAILTAIRAILGFLYNAIRAILGFLYKLLFRYSEIVLLVIIVLVSVQVVLRKVFAMSLVWSEEVSLLLVVWMAFIAMAIGVAENLHISITLFFDRFPKSMQKAFQAFNNLLIIGVGGIMVYYGCILISFTRNSTLPTTKWPTFILYLMIPVAGVYIIYFSLIKLYRMIWRKDADAEEGKLV
jgi:TRAP-type C4-dicarboxylate transport system, small permease component